MNAGGELNCNNCSVSYGVDDIFCENCGYDFITGSLPTSEELAGIPNAPAASPPAASPPPDLAVPPAPAEPAAAQPAAPTARIALDIVADEAFFNVAVSSGELFFPDPIPEARYLELAIDEVHIGRTSKSRAIHPDVDVTDLTGDLAVSSRHAVIRADAGGGLSIVDVGSINGTFVGAIDSAPLVVGVPSELAPGVAVYLGAWTRIVATLLPAET